MQATDLMDAARLDTDSQDQSPPLRVVIAYDDVAAGKRAMGVMTGLGESLGGDFQFEALPWSFNLLADGDCRAVASDDAAQADILVLATSGKRPLPPAVGGWVEGAIRRKQGTAAAVVALLGPEDNPDGTGSTRLAAIQTAAHHAGLDFFAPAPSPEINEVMARIHERVETVTPVLDGILHHRSFAPGTGPT